MADSALSTKVKSTPPDNKTRWGILEAAVEVLYGALATLTVGTSTADANPGSDASTALAVQGVTGGKPVHVIGDAGTALLGKVGIDQTTPGLTNGIQLKQYAGAPSNFTIGTADATVFTLAAGEIGFIQNLSADAPLAVKKGASASTTSLSFILPMRTVAGDAGSGGAKVIDDWIGAVSVAKMTGTASYIAYKQAVA